MTTIWDSRLTSWKMLNHERNFWTPRFVFRITDRNLAANHTRTNWEHYCILTIHYTISDYYISNLIRNFIVTFWQCAIIDAVKSSCLDIRCMSRHFPTSIMHSSKVPSLAKGRYIDVAYAFRSPVNPWAHIRYGTVQSLDISRYMLSLWQHRCSNDFIGLSSIYSFSSSLQTTIW